jgi:ribosomal protein S18 acetylase RimI-like enzyme
MAPGRAGPAERDAAAAVAGDLRFLRDRIRAGTTGVAVAETAAEGVVGAGSHQPVAGASEVMGVGTLPVARRRGIGLAVTGRLVEDARERGAALVVLSAASDAVARLYERAGFRRVGTSCFGRAA